MVLSEGDVDLSELNDSLIAFLDDDLVKDDLLQGVDLHSYAQEIDRMLTSAENDSLHDLLKEAPRLAALHRHTMELDSTLETMEDMLTGFQKHLGSISTEIQSLQVQSQAMTLRLSNRTSAKAEIETLVDGITLSSRLTSGIPSDPIDTGYIELLEELTAKAKFCQDESYITTRVVQSSIPIIEELCSVAVARVRNFLSSKIHALQTPKTNVQIKQGVLSKYAPLYIFLVRHGHDSAEEIRKYYVDVMSKIYFNVIKRYILEMTRLLRKECTVEKSDLLGTLTDRTGGIFSTKTTEAHLIKVFSLEDRSKVLAQTQEELNSQIAFNNHDPVYFEQLFAGVCRLLMNSAVSEFLFLQSFFDTKHLFMDVFGRSISLVLETIEDNLFGSFDLVSMLLMIRILYQNQEHMASRGISCLDQLFDKLNVLLWPRFQAVMDVNLKSLDEILCSDLTSLSPTTVFFILRRCSELVSTLTFLNKGHDNEVLDSSLRTLFDFSVRLVAKMGVTVSKPKAQSIFMIQCYDMCIRVIHSYRLFSDQLTEFEDLLNTQVGIYIDLELLSHRPFRSLVSSVNACNSIESSSSVDEALVSTVLGAFKEGWRSGIEQIDAAVSKTFATSLNPVTRTGLNGEHVSIAMTVERGEEREVLHVEILKRILTQVLSYYQRFQQLMQKSNVSASLMRELVPRQTIIYEIKRLRSKERGM